MNSGACENFNIQTTTGLSNYSTWNLHVSGGHEANVMGQWTISRLNLEVFMTRWADTNITHCILSLYSAVQQYYTFKQPSNYMIHPQYNAVTQIAHIYVNMKKTK